MSDTVRFAGPLQAMTIEEGYDPVGWVALTGEAGEAVAGMSLHAGSNWASGAGSARSRLPPG